MARQRRFYFWKNSRTVDIRVPLGNYAYTVGKAKRVPRQVRELQKTTGVNEIEWDGKQATVVPLNRQHDHWT